MELFRNTIIVSGTARNVGKTTLVCRLIKKNKENKITALKITPHNHENQADSFGNTILKNSKFTIIKEDNFVSNKDTSRMLRAGAKDVYFVICKDEYLTEMLDAFKKIVDTSENMIIESAAIRRYVKPKSFILVYNEENPNIKEKNADLLEFVDLKLKFKDDIFASKGKCFL